MYQNTIMETTRKNEYMLEIEKTNIMNNIEVMQSTAQVPISKYGDVMNLIQTEEEPNTQYLIDFNNTAFKTMEKLLYSNPNIANIRIYTNNPFVIEMNPIIFRESRIAHKPWIKSVIDKGGFDYWDINDNEVNVIKRVDVGNMDEVETYVMLLREIKNQDGSHNGILEVDMRLMDFFSKAFSSVQDPNSQMLVFDRKGRVYTNNKADIFQQVSIDQIRRHFTENATSSENSFSFSEGGVPYLCIQTYIEPLEVHVLNIVSLADSLSDISQTRNMIIVTMVVLIVLLSVITYFLHSLILKKLRILRDSIKKARRGNFAVEFDIRGTDEVGELAYHFRLMLRQINELIVDAVNKQATFKEAELKSLKNQIDSHFLYNTLENLKMMAEIEQQYAISDALTSLGSMMRYSLKWTSNHVRLQDEITHIQNYIAIMNVRYDGLLLLELNIPQELLQQELPKMSLQPIVENAVKHGMQESRSERLLIAINAYLQGDNLRIEVVDDGSGIDETQLAIVNRVIRMDDGDYQRYRSQLPRSQQEEGGIGLRNVDQRMVMHYGKEYGLKVESKKGSYTSVSLTMPYIILTTGEVIHDA
jgi:two-component system sensor histidine kinase YesM